MALSVGVVSINYLDVPQPPVSDFLKDLAMNPSLGTQDGKLLGRRLVREHVLGI